MYLYVCGWYVCVCMCDGTCEYVCVCVYALGLTGAEMRTLGGSVFGVAFQGSFPRIADLGTGTSVHACIRWISSHYICVCVVVRRLLGDLGVVARSARELV